MAGVFDLLLREFVEANLPRIELLKVFTPGRFLKVLVFVLQTRLEGAVGLLLLLFKLAGF